MAVTVAARPVFQAMRAYAESLGQQSQQFVAETEDHVVQRLLRDTEWQEETSISQICSRVRDRGVAPCIIVSTR